MQPFRVRNAAWNPDTAMWQHLDLELPVVAFLTGGVWAEPAAAHLGLVTGRKRRLELVGDAQRVSARGTKEYTSRPVALDRTQRHRRCHQAPPSSKKPYVLIGLRPAASTSHRREPMTLCGD
jgi:hypothetical protein